MITIIALALMGQPGISTVKPSEAAELAASYHRVAWELAGRPTPKQAADRFNAEQAAEAARRKPRPPAPTWADLQRRAYAARVADRFGFVPRWARHAGP